MDRIVIPKIEFYITNVCNLTCQGCNRFNDYNFKGWQSWNDYADIYAKWGQLLDIQQVVILGGEPLLNSTVVNWARGLKNVWGRRTQILSNGTRLNHVSGLYEACLDLDVWVGISIHNNDEQDYFFDEVKKFLKGPITHVQGRSNNSYHADHCFTDANNVSIPLWRQNEFTEGAIKRTADGKYKLHNSDPELAHSVCSFAAYKNYHFIHGKLYKCGPVALFSEFDEQLDLGLSEQDRELIKSYRPLTLENFEEYHKEFFANLDNPIPQCKFCPESHRYETIYPIIKK